MGLLDDLLGESPKIAAVREHVRQLVRSWSSARRAPPVLIQGETGTGKGLVARALHAASPRTDGPFVDFNCVSVPDTLLEAELFGFERGAFTDARQSKPGLFQVAHRGTLFLDEVGLLPLALQGKLLSALESRTVRRLGATRPEAVDVWIIAATNENLSEATAGGSFREDLYHRLAVLTLTLPPLRERDDDAVFLARHFLTRACADYGLPPKTLTADALEAIRMYAWPGNVRQVGNVIERTALLTEASALTAAHLALPADDRSRTTARATAPRQEAVRSARDAEREHLLQALTETGWNISQTAARLAIARNTVHARIRRYGLQLPSVPTAERAGRRTPSAPLAEAAPAPERTTGAPLHWQPDQVSFLLVRLRIPDGSDLLLQPLLDSMADRVGTFGGVVAGRSPVALSVVFRGERTHEPAVLAAHTAMVVLNAARRDDSWVAAPMTIGIGVHAGELLVDSSDGITTLDADGARRTWNLLDSLLEPIDADTIVVTEAAGALLRRRFALTPLAPAGRGYRLDGPWHARPTAERETSALVGRGEELAFLQGRLALAARAAGQVIDLVGEAGIGKSRLLQELVARHAGPEPTFVEGRCSSATEGTPLYPLLAVAREICGIAENDRPERIRERVDATCREIGLADPETPAILARLLTSEPTTQPADPGQAKRRFFEALRQLLVAKSLTTRPLLVAIEDLHWVDPTSEECLASLVETLVAEPILLLTTYRPGYRPPWTQRSNLTQLALPPLSPENSRDIVHGVVAPGTVPDDVVDQIVARGDGNPFFLEELSRATLDKTDGRPLTHVPSTIQEVIALRIGRLRPRTRQILGPAAVLGREVPLHLLCAVSQCSPTVVEEALEELERADLVHRTLRRSVAYARLRTDERRALHLRALETIEQTFRDTAGEHVEALAHHAIAADVADRAVDYLFQASQKARARSAPAAELKHLNQALELLQTLPEGLARDRQELTLHTALGQNLLATKGYGAPEVERAYAQALALCQRVGDTRQLASVLTGQWVFHLLRADYRITGEIAARLLSLARADGHEEFLLEAHVALGMTAIYLGEFTEAQTHLEEALTIHEPSGRPWLIYGTHLGVSSLAYLGWAQWHLGLPDSALRRCRQALALARENEQSSTVSVAQALGLMTSVHLMRGDRRETLDFACQTIAYATDRGFPYWIAFGGIARSWALAVEEGWEAGIAQVRQRVESYRATGSILGLTRYYTLLADMYRRAGQPGPGLSILDEATALAAATDERYHDAEIHRLRGELTLIEGEPAAVEVAETCFLAALDVARRQRARIWELRAATSLARLWREQGRARAGRDLLAAVYGQFTEGLDTADLAEARALLDSSAASA
jgi:transcriptional regulator with AAA-type ATPase domain/predicted ATPase